MVKKQGDTVYSVQVGQIKVEGKTYKEFTLNYLSAIKEIYKELPDVQRLKAYIEYFVDNFSYDKSMRDNKLNKKNKNDPTKDDKERELFELFYTGKGVCEQFSVGFALLCQLDEDLDKSFDVYLADCKIKTDKIMAHALNLLNSSNGIMLIDISAMIHCKEKDNVGDIWDYGVVTIEKYIENQKRNDFEIIPNGSNGKTYLLTYKNNSTKDIKEYYDVLTETAEKLNNELRDKWFTVDISSYFEELNI